MRPSLILPRAVGEARMAERARQPAPADYIEGRLNVPDDWFDREKERIIKRAGWALGAFEMKLNRILVALFVRPENTDPINGGGIIRPETVINEDLYQGVAGLVLKLGPRCYEDSDVITWTDADRCKAGDWALIRRGDGGGFRLRLNGLECILFDNERGIKAVVPRPDVIY